MIVRYERWLSDLSTKDFQHHRIPYSTSALGDILWPGWRVKICRFKGQSRPASAGRNVPQIDDGVIVDWLLEKRRCVKGYSLLASREKIHE